jgi:hypothetical protein
VEGLSILFVCLARLAAGFADFEQYSLQRVSQGQGIFPVFNKSTNMD